MLEHSSPECCPCKADQEPAIVALQREVVMWLSGLEAENSAVALSATNAVHRITSMTRTLKSALESRLGRGIPAESVVNAWALRRAADLLSLYSMDDGGRSPMRRAGRGAEPETKHKILKTCSRGHVRSDFWVANVSLVLAQIASILAEFGPRSGPNLVESWPMLVDVEVRRPEITPKIPLR